MGFNLTEKRPENPSFKEKMIWDILDIASEHDIVDEDDRLNRVIFANGLGRMSDIQLGYLEQMLDVLEMEAQAVNYGEMTEDPDDWKFSDVEVGFDTEEIDVSDLDNDDGIEVKIGQYAEWVLGKTTFTGAIIEVVGDKAVLHCNETGNRVCIGFDDMLITHDVDAATGELVELGAAEISDDPPIKQFPENWKGKPGEKVQWIDDGTDTMRTGVVTQANSEKGIQVKRDDTKTTLFILHGEYWHLNEPVQDEKKSAKKTAWNTPFEKGNRVYYYQNMKRYGTVVENRGDMVAIDPDDSNVTLIKNRWALTHLDPSEDPKKGGKPSSVTPTKVVTTPAKTTTTPYKAASDAEYLPIRSDHGDIISRPVKPLHCR